MSTVDQLIRESESEQVHYTEFILKLKGRKDAVFAFFEGKDDFKYYGIRITNVLRKEYDYIDCSGKENVIKAYNFISTIEEYKEIKKMYFVDMDFDGCPDNEFIYCLPSYSIENQYVRDECYSKILLAEFGLSPLENDFSVAIDLYRNTIAEFHDKSKLLNIWLACQSDIRIQTNSSTRLQIDNKVKNQFKDIVKENFSLKEDWSAIESSASILELFGDSPEISVEQLEEKIQQKGDVSDDVYNRGKFQLHFFVSFLNRLKNEICSKESDVFEKRHKCSARFEYATALSSLSGYAITPDCLYGYLDGFKS